LGGDEKVILDIENVKDNAKSRILKGLISTVFKKMAGLPKVSQRLRQSGFF
jgi:hypothetical protein